VFGLFLPGKNLQRLRDFGQEAAPDGFYNFFDRRVPGFMNSPHIPSFQLYNPVFTNVYRWDLEQKDQLDGPIGIALYMKSMEQLEKMKAE
jgi:hypothetical protein